MATVNPNRCKKWPVPTEQVHVPATVDVVGTTLVLKSKMAGSMSDFLKKEVVIDAIYSEAALQLVKPAVPINLADIENHPDYPVFRYQP